MDLPSDSVSTPPWTFDVSVRVAVLLQASREALLRGDYMEAVALAEEVLEEDPAETDALLLVAEAAPHYGHGAVGLLAANQAEARGAAIGALRVMALLSLGQAEAALAEAERVIAGGGEAGILAGSLRDQALAQTRPVGTPAVEGGVSEAGVDGPGAG